MFGRLLRYFKRDPEDANRNSENAYSQAESFYKSAQMAAERGYPEDVSSNMERIRSLDIDSEYLSDESELVDRSHRKAALNCMRKVYSKCDSLRGKKNGDSLSVVRVGLGDDLWVGSNGVLYVKMGGTYEPNRRIDPEDRPEFEAYVIATLGHDPWMVDDAIRHIEQTSLPEDKKRELKEMLPKVESQTVTTDRSNSSMSIDVGEMVQYIEPQITVPEAACVRKPRSGNRYPIVWKAKRPVSNRMPVVKRFLSGGSFVN